jgi:hypothetical protein
MGKMEMVRDQRDRLSKGKFVRYDELETLVQHEQKQDYDQARIKIRQLCPSFIKVAKDTAHQMIKKEWQQENLQGLQGVRLPTHTR